VILAAFYGGFVALFLWSEHGRAGRCETTHVATKSWARRTLVAVSAAAAVLAAGLAVARVAGVGRPPAPSVTVIDMGPSRAALVRCADGAQILLNAGSPGRPDALARNLVALARGRLAAVIVTRDEATHVEGLREVVREYGPPSVILPPATRARSEVTLASIAAARAGGAVVAAGVPGDAIGNRGADRWCRGSAFARAASSCAT